MTTTRNHSTLEQGSTQTQAIDLAPVMTAEIGNRAANREDGLPAVASMLDRATAGEGVKTIRQNVPRESP